MSGSATFKATATTLAKISSRRVGRNCADGTPRQDQVPAGEVCIGIKGGFGVSN